MVSNILAINVDLSVISQEGTAENRPSGAVPLAINYGYSQWGKLFLGIADKGCLSEIGTDDDKIRNNDAQLCKRFFLTE
jgi:hypothetical protein